MTKTEICNRALAVLGHDRTISDFDTDTATEAERCRQFYASAKMNCLAEHNWDFAAVERDFGAVSPDSAGWARFPLPAGAIRVCAVTDTSGRPLETRRNRDFMLVKSGGSPVRIRYVADDVAESEFTHKFAEAVVYQLASLLAGPMFGSDQKTQNFMNLAQQKLSDAVTKETDETAYRGEWNNPFIKARR